jgi:hypothetical protein
MSKKIKNLKEAFSYTTKVRGQQWDPTQGRSPYNVITGMGYLEDILKGMPRREEEKAKAPKVLPFPLDRITDQLVVVYTELMKCRATLLMSVRTALLNDEEKDVLRKDIKQIDLCLKTIKNMSGNVEQMYL